MSALQLAMILGWGVVPLAQAADLSNLCADRTAIERVYYQHRLGDKPAFEQVSPPSLIERLVKQDLHKEAVLKKVYRVEITPAQMDAEAQRINATTRAPDTLAELKAALGNDPERFARTVVKPILVERELRQRFENDDKLHAAQRRDAEAVRADLLKTKPNGAATDQLVAKLKAAKIGAFVQTTWQLGAAPAEASRTDEAEVKKRFGPNAQVLSTPGAPDRKLYFADLPPDLQQVLRVQLQKPGDVSAVIETPGGFLLYVATAKTAETLSVASLSIPKQNYEQWLQQQE